ncbi:MAG: hypothetical protein SFU57_05755 [Gemmatimonadales bacterium]|nr:hypothetical protein [Gemmatimonadales bacterium]
MVSVQSPDGGVRVAVGRQFSSALSPIGIFDGAALERAGDQWSAGLLLGTQPDVETFAPSTATKEVGLWLQRHQSAGAGSAWSATVGAIGSYQDGVVNREFGYLRGTYSSRAISIYAAQEIDVNRGWKRELEGSAATLTSTFLTARVDIVPALSVGGGFDSRRTIRLYRDMVNPEISFDDAYRRGGWGDLTVRLSSRVRVSADARAYGGGSGTGNTSVTGTFSANRLTRLQFGLRARSTRFTGASSGGSLNSMVVEVAPTRALRLGMNAGQRTNPPATLGSSLARMSWLGADVDLALSRTVYLLISTYRQSAGASRSIQSFGSLSWRF